MISRDELRRLWLDVHPDIDEETLDKVVERGIPPISGATNVTTLWPETGSAHISNLFTASVPTAYDGIDLQSGGNGARLQQLWYMNITFQPVRAARKARSVDETWTDDVAIRVMVEQGSAGQTVLEDGTDAQQMFVPTDWEDELIQGQETPVTAPPATDTPLFMHPDSAIYPGPSTA
jgi:hypothetical protein